MTDMARANGWTYHGAAAGCAFQEQFGAPTAVRQSPERRTLVDFVNGFNKKVKLLTLDLQRRYPTDAKMWRAKERILLAIREDPRLIIEDVGPYLYRFREKIYSGDDEFFITNDYGSELKECTNMERRDITAHIIPKAKDTYLSLTDEEKKHYQELVVGMLDEYVEYLAAQRLDGA